MNGSPPRIQWYVHTHSHTHCKLLVADGLGFSVGESKRPPLTPVPPGDYRWDWPVKNWGFIMISTENQEERRKERNDPWAAVSVPSSLCTQQLQFCDQSRCTQSHIEHVHVSQDLPKKSSVYRAFWVLCPWLL